MIRFGFSNDCRTLMYGVFSKYPGSPSYRGRELFEMFTLTTPWMVIAAPFPGGSAIDPPRVGRAVCSPVFAAMVSPRFWYWVGVVAGFVPITSTNGERASMVLW